MRFYPFLSLLLLLIGCNKEISLYDVETWEEEILLNAPVVYSNDVLDRAYKMANVLWTPLKDVPMHGGKKYSGGISVRGVPYSSVKEINTYLFQDVSYYTFMTAVHNPYSVLYTEDISKAPYHGENCATYYGAVCSSAVMYALGIGIPYYANQIVSLPFMHKLTSQVADSLKICDVIWNPGHVQLIVGMDYRDDNPFMIRVFESSGRSAHIKEYLFEDFKKEWTKMGYVGYRYGKMRYSIEEFVTKDLDEVGYNDDLCPTKGDCAVYRTDETITISLLNHSYQQIVLWSKDQLITSEPCMGDSHQFSGLDPGLYTVALSGEDRQTNSVSFEVVDANVSCSIIDEGAILVEFHSSAKAEYACICDLWGNSFYYPISDLCRSKGSISIPLSDSSKQYCKVIFKSTYGRVSSRPARIM